MSSINSSTSENVFVQVSDCSSRGSGGNLVAGPVRRNRGGLSAHPYRRHPTNSRDRIRERFNSSRRRRTKQRKPSTRGKEKETRTAQKRHQSEEAETLSVGELPRKIARTEPDSSGENCGGNPIDQDIVQRSIGNSPHEGSSSGVRKSSGRYPCGTLDPDVGLPIRRQPGTSDGSTPQTRRFYEDQVLESHHNALSEGLRGLEINGRVFPALPEIQSTNLAGHLNLRGGEYTLVSDILYTPARVEAYAEVVRGFLEQYSTSSNFSRKQFDIPDGFIGLHATTGLVHIHIIHQCPAGNRGCRCWTTSAIRNLSRHGHVLQSSRQYYRSRSDRDKMALVHYICQEDRERRCLFIAQAGVRSVLCRHQMVRKAEDEVDGLKGDVEIRRVPVKTPIHQEQSRASSDNESASSYSNRVKGKRRLLNASFVEEIEARLLDIGAEPLSAGIHTHYWTEDMLFKAVDVNPNFIKNALKNISVKFRRFQIIDYINFYCERADHPPIFAAEDRDQYDEKYYDVEKSIKILLEIIFIQCGNSKIEMRKFLHQLRDWLDRKSGKRNTFVVVGRPNAGKNYVFDSLKSWVLSHGVITDLCRSNRFGLQDCLDKRVAFWDEATFDPYFEEQLLGVLGGTTTNINVKHQPAALLRRTPIMITANVDCIPKEERFDIRCFRAKPWKRIDWFFADKTLLPDPLAWTFIFNSLLTVPSPKFTHKGVIDYIYNSD